MGYSTIESNKLLVHATTWMGLLGVMMSQKSQSKKDYKLYAYLYGKRLEMVNQLRARDRGGLVGGREVSIRRTLVLLSIFIVAVNTQTHTCDRTV